MRSTRSTASVAAATPPRASIMARPPSVQPLPPRPTTMRLAPAPRRRPISWPTPPLCASTAVRTVGGPPSTRQPARLCTFDVRRGGVGVKHPSAVHPSVSGPLTLRRLGAPGKRLARTSTKPGPPSDSGSQHDAVLRTAAPPSVGDGLGGLDRGQAVAEAVRRDQNPHACSDCLGHATGYGRRARSMPRESAGEVTWQA